MKNVFSTSRRASNVSAFSALEIAATNNDWNHWSEYLRGAASRAAGAQPAETEAEEIAQDGGWTTCTGRFGVYRGGDFVTFKTMDEENIG